MATFTEDWIGWIDHNVSTGCDKNGIFKILLDEGFTHQQIKKQMNFEPLGNAATIINPLRAQQEAQRNAAQNVNNAVNNKNQDIFFHNARKLDTNLVDLHVIDNFLNKEECDKIVKLIEKMKRPSLMVNHESKDSSFRTSSTCDLGELNDPFIAEIDQRICKMIGIDPSYSEPLQGQFYDVGQEFKAHTDYFEADETAHMANGRGQRTFTFFINLNDVEEGGTTYFPHLDYDHQPVMGSAIIWNNLLANGQGNHNALHQGCPIIKGTKAIITKWFRTGGRGPMLTKTPNEKVPNYTEVGFEKSRLPDDLFKKLTDFYQTNHDQHVEEFVDGDFINGKHLNGKKAKRAPSSLLDLTAELKKEVHDYMKPVLEEWADSELEPTYVYGIRTYHDTAKLKTHRDRLNTHIISCIINIHQDVVEDWPLQIEDNYYRKHSVILAPGEIVFYESARLDHGREIALKGKAFANIFCHFKPVGYVPPAS
jgi:prolyl 4-hydroxylase